MAVAVALLTPALILSNETAGATTPSSPHGGIYVVLSGDKTFAESVVEASARSPQYREQVVALLPGWLKLLHSGHTLGATSLSGAATLARDISDVTSIQSWLNNPSIKPSASGDKVAPQTKVDSDSSRTTSAIPSDTNGPNRLPSIIKPAFVDHNNPNSFQVRGAPGSGRTYWTGANTAIAIAYCTSSCGETDRITARGTVNPGAVSDRIDITTVYSPNHGNLNPFVDLQFKSINRSNVTGTGNAAQQTGSRSWTQGNGINYRGKALTISIALGVDIYTPPYNGSEQWDGAKTADATCSTTDNTCRY